MGTQQLNLFGDEVKIQAKRLKQEVFEDYDAFLAKFNTNAPKTTDECYTPQPVYEAVLEWLRSKVNIEGRSIVRPFYPGGDYKNYEYPEKCIVVDNPPFSILAQILRFYRATGVDYFLFAPGLTLFSASPDGDCCVVADAQIVYANKAVVCTGFHTSLFPGVKVLIDGNLRAKIVEAQGLSKPARVKVVYPDNVITSALLNKYAKKVVAKIYDEECYPIKGMDCGVKLFGGGVFNI